MEKIMNDLSKEIALKLKEKDSIFYSKCILTESYCINFGLFMLSCPDDDDIRIWKYESNSILGRFLNAYCVDKIGTDSNFEPIIIEKNKAAELFYETCFNYYKGNFSNIYSSNYKTEKEVSDLIENIKESLYTTRNNKKRKKAELRKLLEAQENNEDNSLENLVFFAVKNYMIV